MSSVDEIKNMIAEEVKKNQLLLELNKLKAMNAELEMVSEKVSEMVPEKVPEKKASSYATVVSNTPAKASAKATNQKPCVKTTTMPEQQVFDSANSEFGDLFNVVCVQKVKGDAIYHLTTLSGEKVVWTDEKGCDRDDYVSSNWFTPFEPKTCHLAYAKGDLYVGYVFFPKE